MLSSLCRLHYTLATRMSAIRGSLAAFDSASEDYIDYLQFYFDANGISDAVKQQAILLSCCGTSMFQLLRSLVLLTPLTELLFKDLVAKMKAY